MSNLSISISEYIENNKGKLILKLRQTVQIKSIIAQEREMQNS